MRSRVDSTRPTPPATTAASADHVRDPSPIRACRCRSSQGCMFTYQRRRNYRRGSSFEPIRARRSTAHLLAPSWSAAVRPGWAQMRIGLARPVRSSPIWPAPPRSHSRSAAPEWHDRALDGHYRHDARKGRQAGVGRPSSCTPGHDTGRMATAAGRSRYRASHRARDLRGRRARPRAHTSRFQI